MKRLLITLVILCSILISSFAFAITEQEARKYLDKDIFVIITHDTSCGLYGKLVDVVYIKGELYIVLDTFYRTRQLVLLQAKYICYIRERKDYE